MFYKKQTKRARLTKMNYSRIQTNKKKAKQDPQGETINSCHEKTRWRKLTGKHRGDGWKPEEPGNLRNPALNNDRN